MRVTAALMALGITFGVGLASVIAYADDHSSVRIDTVHSGEHPLMTMVVTATQGVDGPMPESAFQVFENGAPRDVTVRHIADSDMKVVLLIDTSGSMRGEPLAGAKAAAQNFVTLLDGAVAVAVLSYNATVTVVTDFSASRDEHAAAIAQLAAGGFTATFDGVDAAAHLLGSGDNAGSRIVVLLTDGEDNASIVSADRVIDTLVAQNITVHSIEYRVTFDQDDPIRAMAAATGGLSFTADDADALGAIYTQLARELSSRYVVTYLSEAAGDTEVAVQVTHSGTVARDRRMVHLPELVLSPEPEDSESVLPGAPNTQQGNAGRDGLALVIGAGLWFVALVIMMLMLTRPRRRRVRLTGGAARSAVSLPGLGWLSGAASRGAEQLLERRGHRRGVNASLERAGMNMRAGDFVVLVGSVVFVVAAVGTLFGGWVVGVALALTTVVLVRVLLRFKTRRRQARFYDQLGDVLQLLSGSLRAGYSMLQAVNAVAREADEPASEEFGRLVVETRLGRDLPETLHAMADRVQCEDFLWVVQAIQIHREVGGDLAEILDTVAATIRERMQVHRQVKALSAEGRVSAYILVSLPFGLALIISLANPSYLAELTSGLLGWGMLATASVLLVIGSVWLRNLVDVKY